MRKVHLVFLFSLSFVSSGFSQGSWRWDQKVLVDPEIKKLVGLDKPIPTTISRQVNLVPYHPMKNGGVGAGDHDTPRHVTEDTVYVLDAEIIGYKTESNDDDYHIILMDPETGETLVSEIPKPEIDPASTSTFVDSFIHARKSFENILKSNHLPSPTQSLNGDVTGDKFRIPVRVIGVGFWDIYGHKVGTTGKMTGHGKGSAINGREIHPILSMQAPTTEALDLTTPPVPATPHSDSHTNTPTTTPPPSTTTIMASITAEHALAYIVLASIMGMAGQLFRVIVGLKKASDAKPGVKTADLFVGTQFLISLGIAAIVGAVAGVLAAVTTNNYDVTQATYFTYIAAGYAGTDFIEGFVIKN
jgi:hypothetical protein